MIKLSGTNQALFHASPVRIHLRGQIVSGTKEDSGVVSRPNMANQPYALDG